MAVTMYKMILANFVNNFYFTESDKNETVNFNTKFTYTIDQCFVKIKPAYPKKFNLEND